MAENMMFNVANELFVEGRFAYGLWFAEPEILRVWNAIGQYNRFFADNEQYYRGARSLATLAIVLDNRSEGEAILNGLAGRNVLYHVLYEHELSAGKLRPYAAVALLTAGMVRDRALVGLGTVCQRGRKAVRCRRLRPAGREWPSQTTAGMVRNKAWAGRSGVLGAGPAGG